VNGAYGSPDNLVDEPQLPAHGTAALDAADGSYVLRRTHGIRSVRYPARRFRAPHPRTVIRRFFDIANVDRFTNDGEEPRIVLVGFPFPAQGADVLFKAFVQIADRHPQWECVMIGHELKESLERAGMRHPRVKVLPGMPQKAGGLVARCAIMALPSRSRLPRVLMEGRAQPASVAWHRASMAFRTSSKTAWMACSWTRAMSASSPTPSTAR
jgi:glycosyltransferase involved in cell wall biosynthesis